MQRVVILGAGGHGQVVADILLQAARAGEPVQPVAYLDDDTSLYGQSFLGIPVRGGVAELTSIPHDAVVIAIGNNHTRHILFNQLQECGEHFIIARHPHTTIAPDVIIGSGTMICAGVIINTGSYIGANVILNTGSTIDHHNQIGDHVHVAPGVHLGGAVTLGTGCLIGIGATVMPQRSVGEWSKVGAAALVQRDLPDHIVAVGIPARPIKTINI